VSREIRQSRLTGLPSGFSGINGGSVSTKGIEVETMADDVRKRGEWEERGYWIRISHFSSVYHSASLHILLLTDIQSMETSLPFIVISGIF
jgi:hypothetical protein